MTETKGTGGFKLDLGQNRPLRGSIWEGRCGGQLCPPPALRLPFLRTAPPPAWSPTGPIGTHLSSPLMAPGVDADSNWTKQLLSFVTGIEVQRCWVAFLVAYLK